MEWNVYIFFRFDREKKILDNPYLIMWFCKNPKLFHKKIHAIPVGLPNRHLKRQYSMEDFVKTLK